MAEIPANHEVHLTLVTASKAQALESMTEIFSGTAVAGGGKEQIAKPRLSAVSRASVSYRSRPVSTRDLRLMCRIDGSHLAAPFYGSREIAAQLRREGHGIGR